MNGIKAFIFICLLLLAITTQSVYADDSTTGTGNELINSCNTTNSQSTNALWAYCVGYVNGIVEGLGVGFRLGLKSAKPDAPEKVIDVDEILVLQYCIPKNSTREQQALVVSKYLSDHPESLNEESSVLIVHAFKAAWPCDNKK